MAGKNSFGDPSVSGRTAADMADDAGAEWKNGEGAGSAGSVAESRTRSLGVSGSADMDGSVSNHKDSSEPHTQSCACWLAEWSSGSAAIKWRWAAPSDLRPAGQSQSESRRSQCPPVTARRFVSVSLLVAVLFVRLAWLTGGGVGGRLLSGWVRANPWRRPTKTSGIGWPE